MFTVTLPDHCEWEGGFQPDRKNRVYLVSTTYEKE
jgi:hypothetical protein